MTYRNLDRKRFEYLIFQGTTSSEILNFFKACQKKLILNKAKVQNLPTNHKSAVHMLVTELPTSTDHIVQEWFSKSLTIEQAEDPEIIISVYKRFEELDLNLSAEKDRIYARSCLVHLFSKNPQPSLIEFLKTPINSTKDPDKDPEPINLVKAPDVCNHILDPFNNAFLQIFSQILIDVAEEKNGYKYLREIPPAMVEFISGVQSGLKGNIEKAKKAVEAIPVDSILRNPLEQYIKREERLITNRQGETALFKGDFDYNFDEVLAYCTKADKPTAVFVRPFAVVRGNQALLLTDEIRPLLFPKHGDLIAFTGQNYPPQPREGEFGIWKVAEHGTDKGTHFHLASEKRIVYEVHSIPFCSTDHDNVRESIKNTSIRTAHNIQPIIFHLSDGFFVGNITSKKLDFSRDEMFDRSFSLWESLPIIQYEGRTFVLGPLPQEHRQYECANLSMTVRALFRSELEGSNSANKLSKTQLKNLIQDLSSFDRDINAIRIHRVQTQLELLLKKKDAFDALLQELMHHPVVTQRIEDLVEEKAENQLAKKDSLQTEIDRLQNKQKELHEQILKQSEEYPKLPDKISKAVKIAFEKARTDGLSTLAEMAVFKSLIDPMDSSTTNDNLFVEDLRTLAQPSVRDLVSDNHEVIPILKKLGITPRKAKAFSLLENAVRKAGLIICITGVAARPVTESWARALSQNGILIDSVIGLIDDSVVKDALTKSSKPDVLAILDANLSALDLYARSLLDMVLRRIIEPSFSQQPAIFIALTDSIGALPLPTNFERTSVLIDLDAKYVFDDDSNLDDLKSESIDPDDGFLYRRLWKPAANRLYEAIREFNEVDQLLVFSFLKNHL